MIFKLIFLYFPFVRVSLIIGGAAYTSYIAANIYPEPYILLPFSAVIGVGAAILWNAQGVKSFFHFFILKSNNFF